MESNLQSSKRSIPILDDTNGIVQLVRKQPPEHCILKIKSFSVLQQALSNTEIDHINSTEFKAGGYTWVLSVYPNGNKEEGGGGHVSLYVALVDKLESSTLVYASLRFFIYDQIRDNYLTFLEVGENLFNAMKTARGIPKVLPIESFADASNGFLVNDCCTFGVGVFFRDGKIQRSIILPLETECERSYTWKIENFSDFSNLLSSPVFSFGEWSCEITPKRETWKIKVRIIRLWKTPGFEKPSEEYSIEMVLMDEKGSKISATVKKSHVDKFSPLLLENEYRIITNFGVGQNTGSYKTTEHPYKIIFFFSTAVQSCEDLRIPRYGFSFVSYDDIMSNKLDDTILIDVIGEVTSIGSTDPIFRNGRLTRRASFDITNLEGKSLQCTMWEGYADQFTSYVTNQVNGPVVIIIQFGKLKYWQGNLCIQNSLFSTKLHINDDEIDAIKDFKTNLLANGDGLNVIPTQFSSQVSHSISDEFLQAKDQKNLDELRDTKEVTHCVILATIISVETEYNWFYKACKKCGKKVKETKEESEEGEAQTKYYCVKCSINVEVSNIIPRYKVQIRVVDETGSASFVMFDREVIQLLHRSAYYIRESLAKKSNPDAYPEDLNELLERKLLFRIEVSEYNIKNNWPVYTIKKLTDDEELINSFKNGRTSDEAVNFGDGVPIENQLEKSFNDGEKEAISFTGDNYLLAETGESTELSTLKRQAESPLEDCGIDMSSSKKKVAVKKEKD